MKLGDYLRRVAYSGPVNADLQTLTALLRAHVCSVPFENLDVQLGRVLNIALEAAYDKIVRRGRGGWCYEQNGLFCWALSEIGFDVTRVAAAVMRQERGEIATANHLCLLVKVPGDAADYLVDVGFGGSLFHPINLQEKEYTHRPYRLGLRRLDDGFWRFWQDSGSGEFTFDFQARAGDEGALAKRCAFLQTDASSPFVQNLVAQLRTADSHRILRGRILTTIDSQRTETRSLNSAEELVAVLAGEFGLNVPEAASLWPRILARHAELLAAE